MSPVNRDRHPQIVQKKTDPAAMGRVVRCWRIWVRAAYLTMCLSINLNTLSFASEDFVIYSIYKALDLGNPGEVPQKDYYVNMGTNHGVREGTILEVQRKTATYDLTQQKLYKDVSFPIARIKVIHAESNAAIARLEKMLPVEKTPVIYPGAIMVGDFVNRAR